MHVAGVIPVSNASTTDITISTHGRNEQGGMALSSVRFHVARNADCRTAGRRRRVTRGGRSSPCATMPASRGALRCAAWWCSGYAQQNSTASKRRMTLGCAQREQSVVRHDQRGALLMERTRGCGDPHAFRYRVSACMHSEGRTIWPVRSCVGRDASRWGGRGRMLHRASRSERAHDGGPGIGEVG